MSKIISKTQKILFNAFIYFQVIILLFFTTYSCEEHPNETSQSATILNFNNGDQVGNTNDQGQIGITSSITSLGEQYDVEYKIQVIDTEGKPIKNMRLTYGEMNGKSIIYIDDPNQRYASSFIMGTPLEIDSFSNLDIISKEAKLYKTDDDQVIILAIGLIIAVGLLTWAEIEIIRDTYRIQTFLLSDYVNETEDYILYCKTFEEIAEFIKYKYSIVSNLTSIILTFVTAGSSSALEIGRDVTLAGVTEIRDGLVEQAITEWGVTANELVGKKVGLRYYPTDSNGTFSRVQNLFAVCEVILDEPNCEIADNSISGRVTDATTGDPIEEVYLKLTGTLNRNSFTGSNGDYSFTNLQPGPYNIEASKSGYITESRDIDLSGTPVTVNFVLSTTLNTNSYRMVLTWGTNPSDLDAHLIKGNYHISWQNLGNENSPPYAILDIDDVTSYGPETITIFNINSDYSKYYIHNYSGQNYGDIDLKQSEGVVNVYKGSELIRTYNVPAQGTGFYWYVFDLSSNGTIINKNYLTDSPPGGLNKISNKKIFK